MDSTRLNTANKFIGFVTTKQITTVRVFNEYPLYRKCELLTFTKIKLRHYDQIFFVSLSTTSGEPLERYAYAIFEHF